MLIVCLWYRNMWKCVFMRPPRRSGSSILEGVWGLNDELQGVNKFDGPRSISPRQYPPGQYPPSQYPPLTIPPLNNIPLGQYPPRSHIQKAYFRFLEPKPPQSNQIKNQYICQNCLNIDSNFIRKISFIFILKLEIHSKIKLWQKL